MLLISIKTEPLLLSLSQTVTLLGDPFITLGCKASMEQRLIMFPRFNNVCIFMVALYWQQAVGKISAKQGKPGMHTRTSVFSKFTNEFLCCPLLQKVCITRQLQTHYFQIDLRSLFTLTQNSTSRLCNHSIFVENTSLSWIYR